MAASPPRLNEPPAAASSLDHDVTVEREVRDWLARELHDVVLQRLTGMMIDVECCRRDQRGRAGAIAQLDDIRGEAREALDDLRRILTDLRDESGHTTGFLTSIRRATERLATRAGVVVTLHVESWPADLPAGVGLHLHRILEEALSNVRFHSGASSAEVVLRGGDGEIRISVSDDGVGLAPEPAGRRGMGIRGMGERARIIGGRLTVHSRPGGGTRVEVRTPIPSR